jgi:hypothetical protein
MNHKIYALAAVIYLVIALINFWPVASHLTSVVAGTGGDTYQNLWGIWFVGYSLFTLHQGIWHTVLVYWPLGANLVYQTFLPLASFLVTPIANVSLGLAYNTIFFAGFCLSGVTMFLLARYLTKNSYAAFIAGMIFAFSASHIAQSYGHLHYVNIEWVPLALYFFLRIIREDHGRVLKALGLSVSMILACFTGDVELGIMIVLLMVVVALVYLVKGDTRRRILNFGFLKAMLVFLIATFILGAWAWIPLIGSIMHSGLGSLNSINDVAHNAIWSDDLVSFFIPSPYNGLLGGIANSFSQIYHGDISETTAYITYTAMVLAIIGLWKHFKENRLWLGLAVVFFILALGPVLLINTTLPSAIASSTTIAGVPLPFQIYSHLPFFNSIREPGRFDLIFTIALAVMAAFGTKALIEIIEKRKDAQPHHTASHHIDLKALGVIVVLAVLVFVETNGMPLSSAFANAVTTQLAIPQVYSYMGQVQGNFSVLQLPIIGTSYLPDYYGGKAMYYQTESHKLIIGGYTTRENATQELSLYQIPLAVQATSLIDYGSMVYQSPVKENYTNQTLLTLYNYDVGYITLDKTAYNQSEFVQLGSYLYSVFNAPVYNDNTTMVFSTQNAIAKSLYRSYVAYPVLSDWNQTVVFMNGSYVQEWEPVGAGAVSIFAPYSNESDFYNTIYHNQFYYGNTTIKVVAASATPQRLYLGVPRGASNYSVVGAVNLTSHFTAYTFNVVTADGPVGNTYFFLPQYTNSPISILNITISGG